MERDVITILLILSISLYTISKYSYPRYYLRLLSTVLNYHSANKLYLEKNMRNIRGSIFFGSFALLVIGIFISYSLKFYLESLDLKFLLVLANCIIYLFSWFLLKYIVFRFIGYVFGGSQESKEYLFNVFLYLKNLAIFILPIVVVIPYVPEFWSTILLYLGLVLSSFMYIFRIIRGIKILFAKHVSIFYMILYLCGLEILPLLMIYKLFISFWQEGILIC
jgi:hypothetical protein